MKVHKKSRGLDEVCDQEIEKQEQYLVLTGVLILVEVYANEEPWKKLVLLRQALEMPEDEHRRYRRDG